MIELGMIPQTEEFLCSVACIPEQKIVMGKQGQRVALNDHDIVHQWIVEDLYVQNNLCQVSVLEMYLIKNIIQIFPQKKLYNLI